MDLGERAVLVDRPVGDLVWAGVPEVEPRAMLVSAGGSTLVLGSTLCNFRQGCVLPWVAISDGLISCNDTCKGSGNAGRFPGTARLAFSILLTSWY